MPEIFIIEDDPVLADCFARALSDFKLQTFSNAITAIEALSDSLPNLILLDVMLDGPNGFTFLNELVSYSDTAKIPVFLISMLNLSKFDLSHYGVKRIFDKSSVTPSILRTAISEELGKEVYA